MSEIEIKLDDLKVEGKGEVRWPEGHPTEEDLQKAREWAEAHPEEAEQ